MIMKCAEDDLTFGAKEAVTIAYQCFCCFVIKAKQLFIDHYSNTNLCKDSDSLVMPVS